MMRVFINSISFGFSHFDFFEKVKEHEYGDEIEYEDENDEEIEHDDEDE